MIDRTLESENKHTEVLSGHSIIYFGPGKWEGMWRNRHHLMSQFARHNRVIYVEPVFSIFKLRTYLRQGVKGLKELWKEAARPRLKKTEENVYIYRSPLFVPIFGHFPLNKISWWTWNKLLKNTMKNLGFSKPIIWLSQPNHTNFIGNFDQKLVIYHVVDEYLAYPGVTSEGRIAIERSEKQLLEIADLVIVVSEKLLKTKGVYNQHTCLVPNGVDYKSYEKARLDNGPLPTDIDQLSRPIIGYSGLISRRLDLDLLEQIATKRPAWSLALIGMVNDRGCEPQLERLRQMENIHFLGAKDINLVPYYVKAFDVGIIPYSINEETESLSALKLYDFMAVGMPIVATYFPAVREFERLVYVASSKDHFIQCIQEALIEKNAGKISERRMVASQNTWDKRVLQISSIINSRLKDKHAA
jgi:glycosyltransferase involved in cell wall biosynthesis